MNYSLDKWAVAYRKKTGYFLDDNTSFIPLKYDYKGFSADPFLFDYKNETYLFVEYYPFNLGRGVVSYAKYDQETDTFSDFKQIIKEPYHLSYPLVFEHNDDIYMMPEAFESNSLYVYKAVDFPKSWEKHAILLDDIKLVDTTPFFYKNVFYAISKLNDAVESPMLLLKISLEDWKVIDKKVITDDVRISRPGGKVFEVDNEYYMVTQDCEKDYGTAVNIIRFSIDSDMNMTYELIKKVMPEDIVVEGYNEINGIHTYNFNDNIEVIDYKYPKAALYRNFFRLVNKVKRTLFR